MTSAYLFIADEVLTESHCQCDLIFQQAECCLPCMGLAFLVVSTGSLIRMHVHPTEAMNEVVNNSQ